MLLEGQALAVLRSTGLSRKISFAVIFKDFVHPIDYCVHLFLSKLDGSFVVLDLVWALSIHVSFCFN
jgi:hypothetical protein